MSHQQTETETKNNHIEQSALPSSESEILEREDNKEGHKGSETNENHSPGEIENCTETMPSVQTGGWTDSCAPSPFVAESDMADNLKAKKARVENIISTMQLNSPPNSGKDSDLQRRKRKQYQPQPQRLEQDGEPAAKKKTPHKKGERQHLKYLLHHLQQQLDVLQERYQDLYDDDNYSESEESADLDDINEPLDTSNAIRKSELLNGNVSKFTIPQGTFDLGQEKAKLLRKYLKSRLAEAIYSSVDSVVDSIIQKPQQKIKEPITDIPKPSVIAHTNSNKSISPVPTTISVPIRSNSRSFHTSQSPTINMQTEALSLVVPTRKIPSPVIRAKSKTPPSSSSVSGIHYLPASSLATSVAVPNPTLHHHTHPFAGTFLSPSLTNGFDVFESLRYSSSPLLGYATIPRVSPFPVSDHHSSPRSTPPSLMDTYSSVKSELSDGSPMSLTPDLSDYSYAAGSTVTSTLTPTHLRKAKLMFFFTRYPSSAVLRQHFVDVKFNRHNTSQIIKWFSNFREFFYIQMEKFARQALSSGIADPEELEVSRESELFRALNLHYNKSNEYRPPNSFVAVSTTTLREFFLAVKTGRDAEASWKKSIYKVISKLDEPIPSLFRSPNCLDQLPSV